MTISYNWVSEYIPQHVEPAKLSTILTSIGLEVESLEKFESIKGSLHGVVIGQVQECTQHPNADKLKLTIVDVGNGQLLKIVCGASNVKAGQKVLVATIGSTIYPANGEPITIKPAKIRGEESRGMICAEDELGLGNSHEGILVLPEHVSAGTPASEYLKPYTDWIYEIGLTPNRMDAMSHFGVAKDVCAYLSHHQQTPVKALSPFPAHFEADNNTHNVKVVLENTTACKRYAGVTITGVTVAESPGWLKDKLLAIGQRPINNIVDITNYILNETGQPLHAFDLDAVTGNTIIVKNLPQDTPFVTLDEKERKLNSSDLLICDAEKPMCLAGVFGGAKSGVKSSTTSIFLESAYFDPATIRRTSFFHGLRTEAAARFEKGVDISNTVNVLKRAALLIKQLAGGEITSDIVDIYPSPSDKVQVTLKYQYLKKLSGKYYHPDTVKRILTSLGFDLVDESPEEIKIAVPYSKPDISLPADIVEEILRIDGLDNVDIHAAMTITPATDENILKETVKEKISGFLTGLGFSEIVTNSITNSRYYTSGQFAGTVKMINSLSADLDVLRPSMIETGLEALAYNLNRKNKNLLFFEFGKTYHSNGIGKYAEQEHLSLYLTGELASASWKTKQTAADFYYSKGVATALVQLFGLGSYPFVQAEVDGLSLAVKASPAAGDLITVGEIAVGKLKQFDVKQPVFFIDINFPNLLQLIRGEKVEYREVSKFPPVQRDLALVVDSGVTYKALEAAVEKAKNTRLQQVQLFDVFESDKLGQGKKSMAVSFTFMDEEKTLTDKEIDSMMNRLVKSFETELAAEIRK